MRTTLHATLRGAGAAFLVTISAPAIAGPAEDATSAVTTMLDKFNGGDIDAFYAAHEDGAVIVDEFAPFLWKAPHTARHWAADFIAASKAEGSSGGRVDYGKPLQAVSDGKSAYIVLPTTYSFVQKDGTKMAGDGSMTFVMHKLGREWKIASWTYSGATAKPR